MGKRTTLILLFLYLIILISKKIGLYFPELINSYASDLLCIPIILSVARWVIVYLKNDVRIRISPFKIIATVVVTGFLFEYYLPTQSEIYTSDIVDLFMYGVGGFFYYFFQPRLLKSSNAFAQFTTQNYMRKTNQDSV